MTQTLTPEVLAQIKADIAARKAMPEFGESIEGNIKRLHVIGATRDHFSTEAVEMLVNALDELLANREAQPVAFTSPAQLKKYPNEQKETYGQYSEKFCVPLYTAPPATAIPNIGSDVINNATWKLYDTLTEHGPLNGHQFNNLKGCFYEALKIVMSTTPAPSDTQPVALVDRRPAARGGVCWQNGGHHLLHGTELFTAPPAPAVTGDLLEAMAEVIRISDRDHEAWDRAKNAISACRAAMLAQPVSQGYKLDSLNIRAVAALREAVRNQWLKSNEFADKVYWHNMHSIANEIIEAMAAAPEGGNG